MPDQDCATKRWALFTATQAAMTLQTLKPKRASPDRVSKTSRNTSASTNGSVKFTTLTKRLTDRLNAASPVRRSQPDQAQVDGDLAHVVTSSSPVRSSREKVEAPSAARALRSPCSATRPSSMMTIRSSLWTVASRCAITTAVLP